MFFTDRYCAASACTKHERGAVTHSLAGLEDIQCENSEFLTSRIMWSPLKKHWWTFRPSPHIFGPLAELRDQVSFRASVLLRLVTKFRFCLVFLGGLLVKHCDTANAAAITRLIWIISDSFINPFLFVPPLLLSWKHSIHLRKNSSSPTQDSTKISHEGPMLHGSRDVSCTPVWI